MHYVIFSANYLPNIGGIERFTDGLSRAMADMGHQVTIVTNDTFNLSSHEVLSAGVDIIRLPCFPFIGGRMPFPRFGKKFNNLFGELQAIECDGVLINARFYVHTFLGIKFAKSKGFLPVILDHGSAHLTFGNQTLDILVQAYEHTVTLLLKLFRVEFYGISQKSVEWLSHFGIEAQGVISNSIDAAAYRAQASGRSFREDLGIPSDALMLSFAGRFIPEKGIAVLLDMMSRLKDVPVHLVMAGDGPLRLAIEKSGLSSIHMVGRLDAPDIAALLCESDLFCLPTRSEGFSTSLLEASACGTPSLVTDVGGARELMPNDSYGFVMSEADADAFASIVRGAVAGEYDLREMGERCRIRVDERYSWAAVAQDVLKALGC